MLTSIRGLVAASLFAATALATATPALADDEPASEITVTGNVALTTDYRFRGVSLSAGDPAIQGGITVTHASGFYVGTWSSSIASSDVYGGQELDLFGGWSGEVASGLTVDAGLLYYVYPGGHVGDANYFEPYASIAGAVGPAKVKVGVAYAWDQNSLGDDDNLYVYSNLDVGIPNTPLTVSAHLGYTDGVLAPAILAGGTDDSGIDWSIGASATLFGPLSLGVSYIGVDGPSVDGLTDDAVVATLTASF
ncbi:TorF family putative porin [Novosphingobium album (ex Liu et al. 2023)]|uniref:TorF family putative porin n=1 Tax=Novosphingobium album (ex Liu et al. 2023) TaxID=3031130 RepID=A0ABT5WTB7_9SPHN|nr:TorF family putative porin [Novosphingobium album (ex Liu et al. 2023)]MDE8652648.1 TorF family putative porin [Novosphingobium album (ex Liu et al. 2023)]